MRQMQRVALVLGMALMAGTTSVEAADPVVTFDEVDPQVYVVNNHLSDVRVFAEDAEGKLHKLGRVVRGELKTFEISDEVAIGEFRIKVFPTSPLWAPLTDDFGVKTNPLDTEQHERVTVWLEADLASSIVELAG